jgi:hypothetical protein
MSIRTDNIMLENDAAVAHTPPHFEGLTCNGHGLAKAPRGCDPCVASLPASAPKSDMTLY